MNSNDKLEIQENQLQYMKSSWNGFNGPLENILVQEWIPYYGDKKGSEKSVATVNIIIIFQKENGNTLTLLIIILVKSIQKEQNSTNHLLWPSICRNKPAINPKWFNSSDTNSRFGSSFPADFKN